MGPGLLLFFFPCVFAALPSSIVGFNGFNGSVLIKDASWQGWMDGQQRFYLGYYGYTYRWDFGNASLNLVPPVSTADRTIRVLCPAVPNRYSLVYRVPGRLFGVDESAGTVVEIDMETLVCTRINPPGTTQLPGSTWGLALDPLSKDLVTGSGTTFYRITPNATKFGVANISVYYHSSISTDGITIGPDGKIYFASGGTGVGVISATNDPPARLLYTIPVVLNGVTYTPDGMGVGSDGKTLLINTNQGHLLLCDLTNNTFPMKDSVVYTGTHGDVGQVGADGCPYFCELNTNFIFRVTPCIFAAGANHVPEDCLLDSDCTSGNCTNQHCARVDVPHKCEVDSDCNSFFCSNRTCQLAPIDNNCTAGRYCSSGNCTNTKCTRNPVNGGCHVDDDCTSQNCDEVNHICQANGVGGVCVIDTDCKPPNLCADRICKAPVTLVIQNLPTLLEGPANSYLIPTEEGDTPHIVTVRVVCPGVALATGTLKFVELPSVAWPTGGPVGVTGTILAGSNLVNVSVPWSTKAKLGVHNVQMTYSGDGLHYPKNTTINLAYFYFPTTGRFAISDTVALNTQAYFYGPDWKSRNFDIPPTESGGANYYGFRLNSLIPNDNMKCGSSQSVGQSPPNTPVPSYTWLGVPMVDGTTVRAGTARPTTKFGIIKVNDQKFPLSDTGANGVGPDPAHIGVGNLWGTFCPLAGDGGPNGGFLK